MPHARERVTSSLVNASGVELQPFGQRITVLRAAYVGRRPGVTQVYVLVGLLPSGGGAVGPGALAQQRHETAGSQGVGTGAPPRGLSAPRSRRAPPAEGGSRLGSRSRCRSPAPSRCL